MPIGQQGVPRDHIEWMALTELSNKHKEKKMSEIKTYRKKPVEIQAQQFNNVHDANNIIDWMLANDATARYHEARQKIIEGDVFVQPEALLIETLEGAMRADVGDYIIKGVQGEFYPCKPDIFAKTYEDA